MAAAEAAVPEALKYQTLALKVPLHCEGCKREVKRVLQHIEGVYRISFDAQQNKVVVTGNVAAEALIKKLNKAGKHSELWPEPKPVEYNPTGGEKKKKKKKKKNKNRTADGKPSETPTTENPEGNPASSGDEDDSAAEAPDKPDAEAAGHEGKEPAPAPEKPTPNAGAAGGGGGGGGRRKGRNGRKVHMAAEVESAPQEAAKKPAAGGAAAPPAISFSTQLPTYVVSYSSAQPSVSMSLSGCHEATPLQHSRYVYSSASPGSYYIFSEENANACSVM